MNLIFESKYALRLLMKTPAYTALSILIVAFTMAILLVVASLVYLAQFKPMVVFPGSEAIYIVEGFDSELGSNLGPNSVDSHTFAQLMSRGFRYFEVIGGVRLGSAALSDGGNSISLTAVSVSPELMSAAGALTAMGRSLRPEDVGQAVVALSYDAWQNHYAGAEDIIGRQSRIDGEARTIVGVMAKGFNVTFSGDVWLPLEVPRNAEPSSDIKINPILRIPNAGDLNSANAELAGLWQSLREAHPDVYAERMSLIPKRLDGVLQNPSTAAMMSMMALAAFLLTLFGCLNVGSLLFVRALERRGELAVRNAVGATRLQIVRQAAMESFFVCLIGGLAGVLLATLVNVGVDAELRRILANARIGDITAWTIETETTLLLFAASCTLAIWLLSGVLPAYRASRFEIAPSLSGSAKGATAGRSRATSALVGVQVILACFLLIVSGVLVYTMDFVLRVDIGIDSERVAVADLELDSFAGRSEAAGKYLTSLEHEIVSLQQVEQVAFSSRTPGSVAMNLSKVRPAGSAQELGEESAAHPIAAVSGDFFALLGVQILAGRSFDSSDTEDSVPVVIVDESLAQHYWPNEDATGKRIQVESGSSSEWLIVVGVSSHVLSQGPIAPDNRFFLYRPHRQFTPGFIHILAKHSGSLPALRKDLLAAAATVDRDLVVSNLQSYKSLRDTQLGAIGVIIGIFLAVALGSLGLAASGIFAVMARSIMQRTRDIGVRRAMGSTNAAIAWLFVRRGLVFLGFGAVLGGGFAILVIDMVFSAMATGESPGQLMVPIVLGVFVAMAVVILAASYLPTSKVTQMEAGDALRYE